MSVNKVILVGHVGRDPEIRTFDGGGKVASFSLATNENYTDKSGNKVTNTEWHNVSVFGKLADVIEKWCKQGQLIYVEGKLKTDSYEKNGEKRYSTKIICSEFRFLGSGKSDGNSTASPDYASEIARNNSSQNQAAQFNSEPQPDELPF